MKGGEMMHEEITPASLKAMRHARGLSTSQMAKLFGLSGANAKDALREIEDGRRPISGPIRRVAEFMIAAESAIEAIRQGSPGSATLYLRQVLGPEIED